ncbi:uncharacterized protein TNCV_1173101 [Trichonephila clavipes]|uniref:Uncharacterized protein n=1 Tax=Trichonephila clavipes TaxID=2585209 RepID=A0A8X6V3J1_TRICX|nr:uncharacterized protein TNCV_1173101 [Trichonephila clavipes]
MIGVPHMTRATPELASQSPSFRVAAEAEWYSYRIVAGFVPSSSQVPLKIRRVGQRCTLNLSRAKTSSHWCGVVVRRGGASSGVVHVTCPWFKITWSVAKRPHVAEQGDINILSLTSRGRGSLVVKVTNSWPAYHEFDSSTPEDSPICSPKWPTEKPLKHFVASPPPTIPKLLSPLPGGVGRRRLRR